MQSFHKKPCMVSIGFNREQNMKYVVLIILLFFSEKIVAQNWHLHIGFLQNRTTLAKATLPSYFDRNSIGFFPGGYIGVEKGINNRWHLSAYLSLARMDYKVQRYLSDSINLSGTYQPTYENYGLEMRLGRILWESKDQKLQILAYTGFSYHKVRQTGHEYTSRWIFNNDLGQLTVGYGLLSRLDIKGGNFSAVNFGVEARGSLTHRSGILVGLGISYGLTHLPTAFYHVDVRFQPSGASEQRLMAVRDRISPRASRVIWQVTYLYSFWKGKKTR
jgi:hypothetical protein